MESRVVVVVVSIGVAALLALWWRVRRRRAHEQPTTSGRIPARTINEPALSTATASYPTIALQTNETAASSSCEAALIASTVRNASKRARFRLSPTPGILSSTV